MITTLAASVLLLAQSGSIATIGEPEGAETTDVAYETLASGQTSAAIDRLEQLHQANPEDPAILINLGAAHSASGNVARAEECYRLAMDSDTQYQLELADGRWVDSRRAARQALRNLQDAELALR